MDLIRVTIDVLWRKKIKLHADSKYSDQAGQMPRLIGSLLDEYATLQVLSCNGLNYRLVY